MNRRLAALALLTALGGWLRFSSTDFGLPDKYRPDEEYLISRALDFERDWNPHFAVYPAAQMYVQHFALRAYARLTAPRVPTFRQAFAADGGALAYLVARRLSAAFGTATIPATYLITAPSYGGAAALAAAAIVTFVPIHVRESKYATTDAAAVFWLTLAIGAVLAIIRLGRIRDYLAAGLFSGLAIATKYPSGGVLAAVAVAHLAARRREGRSLTRSYRDLRFYAAAYAAAGTFLCATPYLILDWQQTVHDFDYQRGFVLNGIGNPYSGWGWSWLLMRVMPDGFGVELQLLFLSSVLWAVARRWRGALTLATFLAVSSLGMTGSRYVFYRYVVILLPALAPLAGAMVADIAGLLPTEHERSRRKLRIALTSIALAVLLTPSAVRDYKLNRLLARTDTRTLARQWIAKNVPQGSPIAASESTTPYGKPQLGSRHRLVPLEPLAVLKQKGIAWVLSDSEVLPFYSRGPSEVRLAELASGAKLVFDIDPVKPDAPAPVFDQADAFYVPLRHIASMKRPGPRIRIWKID